MPIALPPGKKKLQLFTEEGTRWGPEEEWTLWSKEIYPTAKSTRHSFDPIKTHNNYLKIVLEYTVNGNRTKEPIYV